MRCATTSSGSRVQLYMILDLPSMIELILRVMSTNEVVSTQTSSEGKP